MAGVRERQGLVATVRSFVLSSNEDLLKSFVWGSDVIRLVF